MAFFTAFIVNKKTKQVFFFFFFCHFWNYSISGPCDFCSSLYEMALPRLLTKEEMKENITSFKSYCFYLCYKSTTLALKQQG